MVFNRLPHLRNMTTKAPLRTAQSPSYAVSLSVIPSHSPLVVRRAIKTRTDHEQVDIQSIEYLTCLSLKQYALDEIFCNGYERALNGCLMRN